MTFTEIRQCLANCLFTDHARREMDTEPLGRIYVEEVLQVLNAGEIIEVYPDDRPYSSCLILGRTIMERPLHIVCAPDQEEKRLIIITTYQPDPNRWESDLRRRKP